MNARQDHAPAIADTPDGRVGGVLTRGAIDGAIHAAIAGIGEDLPRRVDLARVDGLDGSHPLGHFAPVGYRLHHPNPARARRSRSEEHTSEIQSRQYLVCRLLLEKKKK